MVIIAISINDVWTSPRRAMTPKWHYEAALRETICRLRDSGARVVLCTMACAGEKRNGANPLDASIDSYADISRSVAGEYGLPLCDMRKAFIAYLGKNNPDNADRGILTRDGVHLNEQGNELFAQEILRSLDK